MARGVQLSAPTFTPLSGRGNVLLIAAGGGRVVGGGRGRCSGAAYTRSRARTEVFSSSFDSLGSEFRRPRPRDMAASFRRSRATLEFPRKSRDLVVLRGHHPVSCVCGPRWYRRCETVKSARARARERGHKHRNMGGNNYARRPQQSDVVQHRRFILSPLITTFSVITT